MGLTKNKAWSAVISILTLILFNAVSFLIPSYHSISFWMGYGFACFSNLFLLFVTIYTLSAPDKEKIFFRLSPLMIAWIYFIVQTAFSLYQMFGSNYPYFAVVITDIIIAVVMSVLLILSLIAEREIQQSESEIESKVFYIKKLKTDLDMLSTDNEKLFSKIKLLAEMVRFSDPMSHSNLKPIENKIENKFYMIRDNLDNISIALAACDDMEKLLNERNEKCKLFKHIPETKNKKDNSGIGIMAATFAIISFVLIVILTTSFIILPNGKYNEAMTLYNNGDYDMALLHFEKMGNYRNSVNMVNIINEKIIDKNYETAMEYYKNQQYNEALKLFEKIGDYKESKDMIEQIYNKLEVGGDIYFGEYNGVQLAWKILKTEKTRMLLILKNPIEDIAFNDELKNITYENSTIRKWLNNEFIDDFSETQKNRIIKENELNDNIFIFSTDEYEEYKNVIDFKTTTDWWLKTKTDAGMMYVDKWGNVNNYGESVVRTMGVRPCVWINLIY